MRYCCSIFLSCAAMIMLSGCIVFPDMPKETVGNENALTCRQLDNEKSEAERLLEDAKAQDHFRPAFLFPPTGFLSLWNIMRAQSKSKERFDYIAEIQSLKGCPQGGGFSGSMNAVPAFPPSPYNNPSSTGYGMPRDGRLMMQRQGQYAVPHSGARPYNGYQRPYQAQQPGNRRLNQPVSPQYYPTYPAR